MHLHGNSGVLQRNVVNQRLFDTVHVVRRIKNVLK